jgi:SAM-dependent methyltransferase
MEYDEDYFENGIKTGKSCYENYRWLPELTIPMAMTIIDLLKIQRFETVLDFGCAKGYLVKAFKLLYRNAFGVDVSPYAIENCDPEVSNRCFLIGSHMEEDYIPSNFSFCVAKDVFEHLEEDELEDTLKNIRARILFVIVPLGENGKYRAPANEVDITHKIRETEQWWITMFIRNGWSLEDWRFKVDGIKENYRTYKKSTGFFILSKC